MKGFIEVEMFYGGENCYKTKALINVNHISVVKPVAEGKQTEIKLDNQKGVLESIDLNNPYEIVLEMISCAIS